MIREIRKITNPNLDFTKLKEQHISIQLSLDGFSFCIYNKRAKEITALTTFEFESKQTVTDRQHLELIKQLFEQEPLLQPAYADVSITHCNKLVSPVPKPLFDKEQLGSYLKYTVKLLENDYITYDDIANTDMVNVYIPFVNVNNFLIDKYDVFTYKHSSTVLIETLLKAYKNCEGTFCFVNVLYTHFEIVVLVDKQLKLFNSIDFNTKEDFIYHLLFTAEQLSLNPEEFSLVLLGDIEKESDLYTIAYQYIRNISFYEPDKRPVNAEKYGSKHAHFTLLSSL